jgi:hypothetical protein
MSLSGLSTTSDESEFICRPGIKSTNGYKLSKSNKSLSYTRARETIITKLKEVADVSGIGLHSFRAGGATLAASSNVTDRCWKRHGRWASDSSKDRYVKESVEHKLGVTKSLGL